MDHAGDFSEAPKTLSHHSTLLRTGSVQQLCWGWHKVRESLCYFSYSALATASGKRWVISISSSEKVDVITKELQTYQLPHQDLPLPKSDPGPLDPDHQRKYECRHFSNAVWLKGYERCVIRLCQMSEWTQLMHKPWLQKSGSVALSFSMWRSALCQTLCQALQELWRWVFESKKPTLQEELCKLANACDVRSNEKYQGKTI